MRERASPVTTTAADVRRRELLLSAYHAAVAAAHPRQCLAGHLPDVPPHGRIIVIGAGKAAAAMAVAVEGHYGAFGQLERISGLVTTRHGARLPTRRISVTEAGHPVPDVASFDGAVRALELARSAGPDDLVLVLLSGGASALWSVPADGVSASEKQALTRQLLKSGAPIGAMNTVRRHLSRIKGGKLAIASHPARLLTLAISDVPGDDPATIGSGPTVADPTTLADALVALDRYGITPESRIQAALANSANETPKPGDQRLAASTYQLVATPGRSIAAAAEVIAAAGYRCITLGDALEGEARTVAAEHAQLALAARVRGERVAILSGGELTVTVTGTGAGGPNQEYALGAAIALGGTPGIAALAADTDGIDGGGGNSDDPAGATIDAGSLARAAGFALNPATFLANNDSTGFFRRTGGLLEIGATQTNVNDLRIVLVDP